MTDIIYSSSHAILPRGRERISALLVNYILDFIQRNNLSPGDLLPPEGQIAKHLGVSRASVRESIKALEALGIVQAVQGKGVYLRAMNLDALKEVLRFGSRCNLRVLFELFQIRTWLEEKAVEEVINKIDERHLAQLEECLNRWNQALAQGQDPSEYDRKFHKLLYAPLDNHTLLTLIAAFWDVLDKSKQEKIKNDPSPRQMLEEHREILAAIRARDVRRAQRAIAQSNSHIGERIKRELDEDVQ